MRASWKYGLFVSIGLLVDRAAAEELDWRPAAAPAATTEAPAAVLGKPVAVRPVQPSADGALRTVSFTTSDNTQEAPTFRLQMPDIPKPMPGANGKQKTGDKSSDLSAPREVRETIGPSFPPPPSPVPGPTPVPGDLGDFCVPSDCGGQGSCADGRCGWGGCCNPGDSHLWWFDAEYLLWWTKSGPAPVLVTTGPPSTFGVLGAAGTVPLFGGPIDYGTASGGRFTTGLWFCECQHFGIDASFFFLGTQSANFFAASDSTGSPVLSRPFTGAITGVQTVEQVAFPGEQAGSVAVHSTSRLLGADTNLLWNPCCLSWCGPCGGTWRWGFLGGFRYLNLKESLSVAEDFTDLGAIVTRHQLTDSFNTGNNFYGGQLGTMVQLKRGPWSLDLKTKVALGSTNQSIHVTGSEVDTSLNTGAQVRFNSGLLALPTNSGKFGRNVFSVVPEVGVNIGYQVCENLRLFIGYDFLFWSNVARPGALIDTTLNTTQQSGGTLVGPARPAFAFQNSNYWAQGINFGLELRY